jgi:endonuclease/exonuclease/phosphatase family metal-dependent hydrolase
MQAHWLIARGPRRPAALAATITRLRNGLFRSRLAGQANAILVNRSLGGTDLGGVRISEGGRERRVVHAVRVKDIGVIGNLHASNAAPDVVAPELERARAFIDALAAAGEARILAGDFNLAQPALAGYGRGESGIDHILVADAVAEAATAWPRERRIVAGRILSDHAPVERLIGR